MKRDGTRTTEIARLAVALVTLPREQRTSRALAEWLGHDWKAVDVRLRAMKLGHVVSSERLDRASTALVWTWIA